MLQVGDGQAEVWLVANTTKPALQKPDLSSIAPGSLNKSHAHWCAPARPVA